jgi:hypothetical protein
MLASQASLLRRPSRPAPGYGTRVGCRASSSPRSSSAQPAQPAPPQQLLGAASAALLGLALALAPAPALAEEYRTIADVVQADFVFVDGNKDGMVTQQELRELSKQLASEADVPGGAAAEPDIEFTYKLFDLNADGVLTTEEVLRSIALDGAVSDDAVDSGVFKLVDSNSDGRVDRSEFVRALGDFGPSGDEFKGFVFARTDYITGGQGRLDVSGFANALVIVRNSVLGY